METIDLQLKSEIVEIISKILEIQPSLIGDDQNFIEDLGADSMMALEIMVALEKKYKIDISEEKLPKMSTLRQTINLVQMLLK
jgi:acyl carrier protein